MKKIQKITLNTKSISPHTLFSIWTVCWKKQQMAAYTRPRTNNNYEIPFKALQAELIRREAEEPLRLPKELIV